MTIQKKSVVLLKYILKDSENNLIEDSQDDGIAILIGQNAIIPKVENELLGKQAGEKFSISVNPQEGFGEYDSSLVEHASPADFEGDFELKVGMAFQKDLPDGSTRIMTVTNISGDDITLDGNHNLAGKNLIFDVEIVDVREATEEELRIGLGGGCCCGEDCGGGCSGCGGGCGNCA
mgnify:CR=1 FL=1